MMEALLLFHKAWLCVRQESKGETDVNLCRNPPHHSFSAAQTHGGSPATNTGGSDSSWLTMAAFPFSSAQPLFATNIRFSL